MKKIIFLAFVLSVFSNINAQQTIKLGIDHKAGTSTFTPANTMKNDMGNDFNVTRLEYYLSKISIIHDGGKETPATDVYALINAEADAQSGSTEIDLGQFNNITTVEAIKFNVGVNTPENNEDPTQWPATHPLAPKMPSMHWGWTAGYRFVALEGNGGANLAFPYEFHALGNDYYYTIQIPTTATDVFGQLHIYLNADYTKALKGIDVSSGAITHGVGTETIQLLRNFRDEVFSDKQGNTNILASTKQVITEDAISIYPNPSNGKFTIDISDKSTAISSIQITDITGKVVETITATNWASNEVSIATKGVYLVNLMSNSERLLTKKLVIQ